MKKFLIYSTGVVLFYLLVRFCFSGHSTIFPVFMISSFVISFFLSKKEVIFSFSLITFIWIINFFLEDFIISTLILYFVFTPLTFYLGYFLKNKHFLYKLSYGVLLILVGIYGFSNFWYYIRNFDARQMEDSPKMMFFSNENKQVRLDTIKDKIIVLDYWTTSCGVCFQKFPEYEKLYLKYKDNSKVLLYAF